MRALHTIPRYEPIIHRLKGKVQQERGTIYVGGVEIPKHLKNKFLKRTEGWDSLQDAVNYKQILLRGCDKESKLSWFGLVSNQFLNYHVSDMARALADRSRDVSVNYDSDKERYFVNYRLGKGEKQINLHLDSADFGTYGGNGEMAVRAQLSFSGKGAYTLSADFLQRRFIHRVGHGNLTEVVEELHSLATQQERKFTGTYTAKAGTYDE